MAAATEHSLHLRFDCRVFRLPSADPARWAAVLEDSLRWMVANGPDSPQLQKTKLSEVVKDQLSCAMAAPQLGKSAHVGCVA